MKVINCTYEYTYLSIHSMMSLNRRSDLRKLFIRVCDTEDDMTGVEIQNINVNWYLKEDFYHKIYGEDDDLVMMFEEEQMKWIWNYIRWHF